MLILDSVIEGEVKLVSVTGIRKRPGGREKNLVGGGVGERSRGWDRCD